MGGLSSRERADKDQLAYQLRMKKRAENRVPPLEITEKGKYITLLYDITNGRKLPVDKKKIFDELHKIYGKKDGQTN